MECHKGFDHCLNSEMSRLKKVAKSGWATRITCKVMFIPVVYVQVKSSGYDDVQIMAIP